MKKAYRSKLTILATIAIVLLFCLSRLNGCIDEQGPELTFIHTNDTHSQIDCVQLDKYPSGGVVERASFIEMMKKEDPQLVYLDAGDMVQGSPYFNIWNGMVEMKAMNLQGLIATTFGNHEFDNGVKALCNMMEYAAFPIVSCNYDVSETPLKKYIRKAIVIERKGVKIGITGVTLDPNNLISKQNIEGIRYLDPLTSVNNQTEQLRQDSCDIIVVLSHLGYYPSDTVGDRWLAANSHNIDLIIGGHTHRNIENGIIVPNADGKPVMITQTGAKASPIGYAKVKMKKARSSKYGNKYEVADIVCGKLHPDLYDLHIYGSVMSDFIAQYRDSLDIKMGTLLGTAARNLPADRPQSPLGNLVSDVIRKAGAEYCGHPVDVGIMNVGGLRDDLNAGDIKLEDIYQIFPFENTLVILKLKGKHLEEVIHQVEEHLEAFSGTQITLETTNGHTKASDILVGNAPIDPEKVYYVATIDYLAEGNDGLLGLTQNEGYFNTGILLRDIMIKYVRSLTAKDIEVDAKLDNRVIVKEDPNGTIEKGILKKDKKKKKANVYQD